MAVGGSLQSYGQAQAQPLLHWAGLRQHGGSDNPRGLGAHDAQLEWVLGPRGAQGPVAHRLAAPDQEAGVPGRPRARTWGTERTQLAGMHFHVVL